MLFTIWIIFRNIRRTDFFLQNIQNMQNIKTNSHIIFLKFFLIIFFWWIINSLPVIFIYKTFNFCGSYLISSWFSAIVPAYWKHLLSFSSMRLTVAFLFLSNQGNLYMIHHDSDLFYDIYNNINERDWRQTQYVDLITNFFLVFYFKWIKNFFYNFIPADKYWSYGRLEDVSLHRPRNSPKDPIWPSRDIPIWRSGDVLKWRPGDVDSGRPLEDLQSTQNRMSQNLF